MIKILISLLFIAIASPANADMATGLALGLSTGMAIESGNNHSTDMIRELVNCENKLKPELINTDNSFQERYYERYYDCLILQQSKDNLNQQARTSRTLETILAIIAISIVIIVGFIFCHLFFLNAIFS
jgi:hypothetical protein